MAEPRRSPETRDVSAKALLIFAAGFVGFLAIALGVLVLVFETDPAWPPPGPAREANRATPALQRAPRDDLAAFRRRETKEMSQLGWVDREAGIARIPVEEAMRIVVENGLPDWAPHAKARDEECRMLLGSVPRAPQAARCRKAGGAEGEIRP